MPPNKTFDDQYNFGFFHENTRLSGLVNIIDGYPEDGVLMLGLMLIDPSERNIGLGKFIHQEILNFAKVRNGKKIRIGVIEENARALKFWKSLGYQLIKKSEFDRGNNRVKSVLIFSLAI